jgi:copper chaperone CopZ
VTIGMTVAQDQKTIPITGMDCPLCIVNIEKELKKLEGVKEARGNYIMEKVVVTYDPSKIDILAIEKKIEDLGYRVSYIRYPSIAKRIRSWIKRSK